MLRHGLVAIGSFCLASLSGCSSPPDRTLTIAERSDYTRTATYAETVALMDALADPSALPGSRLLRRTSMGRTGEGRDIPMLILSDPPVTRPAEAFASGKVVVLAFGNIHAGEVCGKEALPMLVREIVREPYAPWARAILENTVLLVAPIYNADGNERFGLVERHRPGQVGPRMVGVRPNAQGLDLNRDYMKLDAPETRAMVRLMNVWRPHVVIDTHTTNGSLHRYVLTFGASQCPAGAAGPREWTRDVMLPEVSRRVRERTGYDTFWYGDFDAQHTEWRTYPWHPRYGGGYHGLVGVVSILTEAYSYAPFKDRVLSTMEFVRECLMFAAEERVALLSVVEEASRAAQRGEPDEIGIRFDYAAFESPVVVKGWQERPREGGGTESTGVEKDYTVRHFGRFAPTLTVSRPAAYFVPPGFDDVIDTLRAHGIEMEEMRIERDVEVEESTVRVEDGREFQGRSMKRVDVVETRRTELRIGRGWWRVPADQRLGNLVVYLLEPASDDGFAAWGFFGEKLSDGGAFPVVRQPRGVTGFGG